MRTQVIGNYTPENLPLTTVHLASEIYKHITPGLQSEIPWSTFIEHWRLRGTDFNYLLRKQTGDEIYRFHTDGSGKYNNDLHMIIWSNIYPTEIVYPDLTSFPTKAGDIVLLNNREVFHRTPSDFQGQQPRYFGRAVLPDWETELPYPGEYLDETTGEITF